MDPKVCGKLLTTHQRGYGVDVEALRGRYPSGGAPAKAPRWDLADTEGYGGGTRFSWLVLMFSGYGGIYRGKKEAGGRPRGPRDRGRALQGWARPPPSWPPWLLLGLHSKSSRSRLFQKSRT